MFIDEVTTRNRLLNYGLNTESSLFYHVGILYFKTTAATGICHIVHKKIRGLISSKYYSLFVIAQQFLS